MRSGTACSQRLTPRRAGDMPNHGSAAFRFIERLFTGSVVAPRNGSGVPGASPYQVGLNSSPLPPILPAENEAGFNRSRGWANL